MKKILNVILHLWQLPQHIVAWFIILFCQTSRLPDYKGRRVYLYSQRRGCCLGNYIFLNPKSQEVATQAHEYGHSRQSLMLGWLYFIIVGLPSATNVWSGARYYSHLVEWWANKLGGVEVVRTGTHACDYYLKLIE